MLKVSIIIPIVRPEGAQICMEACVKHAGIPRDEYEFVCAEDINREGCSSMVNYLTENSNADIVCLLCDDNIPEQNFLKEALLVMNTFEGGWGVVKLNDHQNVPWPQAFLLHKKILPYLNDEVLYSGYWHICSDEDLWRQATTINRYKKADKACIIHDHPSGTVEAKKRYGQIYSRQWQTHDKWILEERKKNGFKPVRDPSFTFNKCLYLNEQK